LIGPGLTLWHATLCADALLKDAAGRIHFLDTLEGAVGPVADSEADFARQVSDPDNADRWLMTGLVDGAALMGLVPAAEQCLCFKIPPGLGGSFDLDNVEVGMLSVQLSISGQLSEQIRDLPPGTKISEVRIVDPGA